MISPILLSLPLAHCAAQPVLSLSSQTRATTGGGRIIRSAGIIRFAWNRLKIVTPERPHDGSQSTPSVSSTKIGLPLSPLWDWAS
jgi:hypothetical protein